MARPDEGVLAREGARRVYLPAGYQPECALVVFFAILWLRGQPVHKRDGLLDGPRGY